MRAPGPSTLTSRSSGWDATRGQSGTAGGYEKARQWNIDFAGEHRSQDFQGFMEGGASEGLRAASEVLADLKKM